MARKPKNQPEDDTIEDAASEAFGDPVDDDDEDLLEVDGLNDVDGKYLVPEGYWEARTLSVKKELSKSSGKPMLTFDVALTGNVLNDDGVIVAHADADKHGGKEFKTYVSLAKAALFKVKEMAVSLDIPIQENGRLRCKLSALKDKRFIAKMQTSEYESRESSKVQNWVRHPDGPEL